MMQKKKIQDFTRWLFYALTIVSLVLLVPTTVNYLEFFVAMNSLSIREDFFNYVEVEGLERIRVNANFTLIYNSSYTGLRLNSIYVALNYEGGVHPLVSNRFWFGDRFLDSFSEVSLPFDDVLVVSHISQDFLRHKEDFGIVNGTLTSVVYLKIFGSPDSVLVYLDDVSLDL